MNQDWPWQYIFAARRTVATRDLTVGILCGWDMHLIPLVGYARAFVSHDEFVEFAADDANSNLVHEWAAQLGGAKVRTAAPSA